MLPIFATVYLLWFIYVYPCLLVSTYVYTCLPMFARLHVYTYVYHCLLEHDYLCLPMFTRVYLCLHSFNCLSVNSRLLIFTIVYSCFITYNYPCLLVFTYVYTFYRSLPLFTSVYLCLPMFTTVYSCLHSFTTPCSCLFVTQYCKTSLIAALLILRYGRVKSLQVCLAKKDCFSMILCTITFHLIPKSVLETILLLSYKHFLLFVVCTQKLNDGAVTESTRSFIGLPWQYIFETKWRPG